MLPVPFLLLSGTVPHRMETTQLPFAFGSSLTVFRTLTARPNLKYSIVSTEDEDITQDIVDIIKKAMHSELAHPSSRAIIYCPTLKLVNETHIMLCKQANGMYPQCFYGAMGVEEKDASLKSWREGPSKVMVATSSFGTGIDYGQVKMVIHHSYSVDVLSYIQEGGRAGRDGQSAECILVADNLMLQGMARVEDDDNDEWKKAKKAFAKFILSPGCIRQNIQAVVDDQSLPCVAYPPDFRKCSVCESKGNNNRKCIISHPSTTLCLYFFYIVFLI